MRFLIFLFLLLLPPQALALEVSSMSPATGATGQAVVITGGPFEQGTEILFGDHVVRPETIRAKELRFAVPALPEGEYALRVRAGKEIKEAGFTFRVLPPTPRLHALTPATLDSCSLLQGQRVILSGEFPPRSQVLLDGATIPAERIEASEISLLLPPLNSGIHQIEVASGGQRRSLPHALVVNGVPRIAEVNQGTDQVTSYEVVISGENFLSTSVLMVNGASVSQAVEGDVAQNYTALNRLGGEDYLRYVDCRTLAYIRHPVTRVPKSVTFQVVNPGGEQSPVYVVVIP